MKLSQLGPSYWRLRLQKWPKARMAEEGYALLLPVPGDLPVFLRLALAVCSYQDSRFRVQTIVVPDQMTPAMRHLVAEARPNWSGELLLQPLPLPERWVLPWLGNPGRNHAFQLVTGAGHCGATHIVLHDADLFLLRPDQLDRQFEKCRDGGLACLGISPAWDPWFAEHGRQLAATWELCAAVKWLRGFAPASHMAHDNELFGAKHTFDTTFYPQAMTDQALIGVSPSDDVVHFNYVISNYRRFRRQGSQVWTDVRFRLLLVSLFVELFDKERWASYRLPDLAALGRGLGRDDGPVQFPDVGPGAPEYASFRALLSRALDGPWVAARQLELASSALAPFDRFYSYEPAGSARAAGTPGPGASPQRVKGPPPEGSTTAG